jgi:hypothetical protein
MISNQATDAVWTIDLGPIKAKLMHMEAGEGWSRQRADIVEVEYRRFLHLMKIYPNEQLAPSVDTDTFWHYHILDTMKYAVDCDTVFGYFLHHFPYLGLRGEDDEQVLLQCGDRMRELYESTFAVSYLDQASADTDGVGTQAVVLDSASATTGCEAPAMPDYCHAAGKPAGVSANSASYCAAPSAAAYCAAPARPASNAAYCAAPARPFQQAANNPAYCAAPARPSQQAANNPAYCAAPARPGAAPAKATSTLATGSAAGASAAGPAYCAAPSKQGKPLDASSYRAAPAKPAYCAAPARPASKSTNSTSYCAAPAKPAYCAAPSKRTTGSAYCASPAVRVSTIASGAPAAPNAELLAA